MKNSSTICDGCEQECKYYIEILDSTLRCANGGTLSVSLGFRDLQIKNKHFCCYECLINYFYDKMPSDKRGDYIFPGYQVGKMSAAGKELQK